jgi:glycosyltransferase involved in cell wall biosynthesis
MRQADQWRVLIIPTHPGVQYHFCRVGLPTYFLGHWDQFRYWRPQPPNVHNLLPAFDEAQLRFRPADYRRLLDEATTFRFPDDFDVAWLMFNWQVTLLRDRRDVRKFYRVAKFNELTPQEWEDVLGRDDFAVASFYPNTVAWLKDRFGVDVPYLPLGLDPETYHGYTGESPVICSVIHSWAKRGWHYPLYLEATAGLPTLHIDHLNPAQAVHTYNDLVPVFRRSRLYLHDGEQEYTITLIEALMTGMPVVSFPVPGIERYVVHGSNGFVGRTANQVREYCRLLLDDADLAARMGKASRELALRNHSESRWRDDWIAALGHYLGP